MTAPGSQARRSPWPLRALCVATLASVAPAEIVTIGPATIAPAAGDCGQAVAIDGAVAVVGVPEREVAGAPWGAAFVMEKQGGAWVTAQELLAPAGGRFGDALALAGDTLVVGAPGERAVYVFAHGPGGWTQVQRLTPPLPLAGFGKALALDGDTLVVGAPQAFANGVDSGAAFVFVRDPIGGAWSAEQLLVPSDGTTEDRFGLAVAVDGDRALIGAPRHPNPGATPHTIVGRNGAAYAFERTGTTWLETQELSLIGNARFLDELGHSVSLDGTTALVGCPQRDRYGSSGEDDDTGAVEVFEHVGGVWTRVQELWAIAPGLGTPYSFGVSLARSGERACVGSTGSPSCATNSLGAVYVLERQGATWAAVKVLVPPCTPGTFQGIGQSVALDGPELLAGGPNAALPSTPGRPGAAFGWRLVPTQRFCDASDGALGSCPCSPGTGDSGCDILQGTGGVRLAVVDQDAAVTPPELPEARLDGSGYPPAAATTAILLRSTAQGPAVPFGDGVRCVAASSLVRTGVAQSSGGVATHVVRHQAGPGTFWYQAWFRAQNAYCTPALFGASSGATLTW